MSAPQYGRTNKDNYSAAHKHKPSAFCPFLPLPPPPTAAPPPPTAALAPCEVHTRKEGSIQRGSEVRSGLARQGLRRKAAP